MNPFSLFRRRRAAPKDAAELLHADVLACARVLGRKLPPLGKRYSMQAFTIALAVHLKSTLKLGLKDGYLTDDQATTLVGSLLSKDEDDQNVDKGDQEERFY